MRVSMPVRIAKWYLGLAPVVAPDYYARKVPLQRARMEYESERSPEGFHHIFQLALAGKDLLDLGCGYGGRTVYYKELGARSVAGVEVREDMTAEAIAFGRTRGVQVDARIGVGESIPFADCSFDVITSYDVFEHVESLEKTLSECHRVLRPGGTLYAAFPPFYHPTGGSHLHGYVSRSPAPNILFSAEVLLRAIALIQEERGDLDRPYRRPSDPLPSVNGISVRVFLDIVQRLPFSSTNVTLQPLRHQRLRALEWVPRLAVRLPILREVCTSRIRCEFIK